MKDLNLLTCFQNLSESEMESYSSKKHVNTHDKKKIQGGLNLPFYRMNMMKDAVSTRTERQTNAENPQILLNLELIKILYETFLITQAKL